MKTTKSRAAVAPAEKRISVLASDLAALDAGLPTRLLLKLADEKRFAETFELFSACGALSCDTLSQLFAAIPKNILLEADSLSALQSHAKLSTKSKLAVCMAAISSGHEEAASLFIKKLGHKQLREKIILPELPFGYSRTYGSAPRYTARATLLEAACLYGRPQIAKLILEADGPAQIQELNETADVRNALFFSIGTNHSDHNECLALLLNAGADHSVWRLFKDGISIEGSHKTGKLKNANALRFACALGNAAAAKLLTAAGADPCAVIPGSEFGYRSTPFLISNLLPDKTILEHFLSLGPDWKLLAALAPKSDTVIYRPFPNPESNVIFAQAFEIELASRFQDDPQALVATRMAYDCARSNEPPEEIMRWAKLGADPRIIRDCLARIDDNPSRDLAERIELTCSMLSPAPEASRSKPAL